LGVEAPRLTVLVSEIYRVSTRVIRPIFSWFARVVIIVLRACLMPAPLLRPCPVVPSSILCKSMGCGKPSLACHSLTLNSIPMFPGVQLSSEYGNDARLFKDTTLYVVRGHMADLSPVLGYAESSGLRCSVCVCVCAYGWEPRASACVSVPLSSFAVYASVPVLSSGVLAGVRRSTAALLRIRPRAWMVLIPLVDECPRILAGAD
jgi:hypothetical protein